MIKTIIFDFDDTLYFSHIWDGWPDFLKDGFKSLGLSEDEVDSLAEKYKFSNATNQATAVKICKIEGLSSRKFRKYLKTHICMNNISNVDKISNRFLYELSREYNLYLLSLSEKAHIKYYSQKYGIKLKFFKKIITLSPLFESKAVEMKRIMRKEKVRPDQMLMVGDSLNSDIKPAQSLGIQTFQCDGDYNKIYKFFTENNILDAEKYIELKANK